MIHTHYLNSEDHSDFLEQGRIDPITGEIIEEGHTIVICAACKSAFFIANWEYLGGKHYNQENTLAEIPINKTLTLEAKPLEYLPFLLKKGNYYAKNDFLSVAENFIVIFGLMIGISVWLFSIIWIGHLTGSFGVIVYIFASLGLIQFIARRFKGRKLFSKTVNPQKATYIALDYKSKGVSIKRKNQKQDTNFDNIQLLRYSIKYLSYNMTEKYNQCLLSIELEQKNRKKQSYYSVIHQDEIPYWSEFLEGLPYSMRVLNV